MLEGNARLGVDTVAIKERWYVVEPLIDIVMQPRWIWVTSLAGTSNSVTED